MVATRVVVVVVKRKSKRSHRAGAPFALRYLQPFSPLKHRYFSSETPIFLLRNTDISPLKHRYFSSETPIVYFDGALHALFSVLFIKLLSSFYRPCVPEWIGDLGHYPRVKLARSYWQQGACSTFSSETPIVRVFGLEAGAKISSKLLATRGLRYFLL